MPNSGFRLAFASASFLLLLAALPPAPAYAQEQVASADAAGEPSSPDPLSEDELEILVARIALYPDELIGLISGASLYPLQIVEAGRFLDQYEKDKSLKPKESWDGSVVSLLNYPEVVRMMSEDLDWTQAFGTALAYQQKDVLVAIQQLRDEAVAKGVIKSDDKVQVVEENDNVVIRPTNPEVVYVPQYEPEMLYVEDYVPAPIGYYPEPYPPYWYPGGAFFAGATTGAFWGAIVDWDDWGVWGGDWDGGDIDIDCNDCFNNRDFNGRLDFNDVDWNNIDRDKINIDRDQINKLDRGEFKNRVKQDGNNALRDRAKDVKRAETRDRPGKAGGTKDVRKSVQDGLKAQGGQRARPAGDGRPAAKQAASRPAAATRDAGPKKAARQGGKPKPAKKADNRTKKPSGLGNPSRGKQTKVSSNRGHKSMGGGSRGGAHKQVRKPSGGGGGRRGGGGGGGGRRR